MAQTIIEALPSILCMLAGAGFIIVEVFLPGFGIPGISGILLIGAGTVLAGIHFGALTAIGVLLVLVAILAVLISWVLRAAAHSDGGERIFLRDRNLKLILLKQLLKKESIG